MIGHENGAPVAPEEERELLPEKALEFQRGQRSGSFEWDPTPCIFARINLGFPQDLFVVASASNDRRDVRSTD